MSTTTPSSSTPDGRPVAARRALVTACVVATLGWATAAAEEPRWTWEGVERVVAVGDLHGQYDKLVKLVTGTGLADAELDWSGGAAHLVLCGDLVDRGPRDRSVLDLASKLQRQAAAAGGRVHVLLGNHEVMNLTRDLRYVSRESFSEYAPDENAATRRAAFIRFRSQRAGRGGRLGEIQTAFAEAYPPGYFAHLDAFSPDGEYGAWLLEQPTVVRINGIVYVHGGLTPAAAALGIDEINRRVASDIRSFVELRESLESDVPWPRGWAEVTATVATLVEGRGRRRDSQAARTARDLFELRQNGLAFAPAGPVWYRGLSIEDEKLERENVERVLDRLGASALVVGHTVTRSGRISSRFGGRVLRTDVGMGYGRAALALVLDGDGPRVFDPTGTTLPTPLLEPPQGEGWPQGESELADEVLERFLERAKVTASREVELEGVPFRVLELEGLGMHMRAAFGTGSESAEQALAAGRRGRRRFEHQVAAYRVDRLLGLGMVPVSVPREVEGEPGMLQIWMQSAVALPSLELFGGFDFLAGIETQLARGRAFSSLIGNEARMDVGKMLLPVSRQVVIADNGIAFPVDADAAHYLPEGCGPVGAAFLAKLRALARRELATELEGLVGEAEIDAVLARRDALLELCATPHPGWSIEEVLTRSR